MKSRSIFLGLGVVCAANMGVAAMAAPVTFFGENLTPNSGVSGDPLDARNSFVSNLTSGFGFEDFESGGLTLDFQGTTGNVTAILSGGGATNTDNASTSLGRFPTSGSRYINTNAGGDFTVTFSDPISAFGFYATDIGDFGGQLELSLFDENDNLTTLMVPHTLGDNNSTNGSLLFFGFFDLGLTYTRIVFDNLGGGGGDAFGFDDMIVGDIGQIDPNPVPLPGAALFFFTGLAGAVWKKRHRVLG